MITFPSAKINIGLNVVSKREDGYHNIETVFYPVNLQDALEINLMKPLESGVLRNAVERTIGKSIPKADTPSTPPYSLTLLGTKLEGKAEENLVVKAYLMLLEDFHLPAIEIHLYKHIPTGAGLGGGSSDCAAMIQLLSRRFGLRLTDSAMERYAARLGSDCAFFIKKSPVFATGRGEVMEPVSLSLSGYTILIVKPDVSVSTAAAYAGITPHAPETALTAAIQRPIEEWRGLVKNDFEDHVFNLHPQLAAIKEKLYSAGALYASMTGSGSALYGIFKQPLDSPTALFPGTFCRQRELQ